MVVVALDSDCYWCGDGAVGGGCVGGGLSDPFVPFVFFPSLELDLYDDACGGTRIQGWSMVPNACDLHGFFCQWNPCVGLHCCPCVYQPVS